MVKRQGWILEGDIFDKVENAIDWARANQNNEDIIKVEWEE